MTEQPRWTDEQLEAYHDGELSGVEAARLAKSLDEDPTLLARFEEIRRVDALVRQALTRPIETKARAPIPLLPIAIAGTGILGAAAAVVLLLSPTPPQPGLSSPEPMAHIDPEPVPTRSRVLVTLTSTADMSIFETPIRPIVRDDLHTVVLDALSRGDPEAALQVARTADKEDRQRALKSIGLALSVERSAVALLDAMTPLEQLEACETWVEDPRFRPATFTRLRLLAENPDLAPKVQSLLNHLELQPELTAWVRSYRPRT